MPPELVDVLFQASRWLFAFLGIFSVLTALGWLHAEKKARRERLRSAPSAGTVGELLVLSGSDELPAQTWFPVTREGVLGSVRSCDVVVPCPGVKAHHLDYQWKDGVGLLIRPRSGCEALIDGNRLDCRSNVLSCPLTHGACLQVGQAVLRLQVFKALNVTCGAVSESPAPPVPVSREEILPYSAAEPAVYSIPETAPPVFYPGAAAVPPSGMIQPPEVSSDLPYRAPVVPPSGMIRSPGVPSEFPYREDSGAPAPQAPMRRRSDSWKEDWSE